MRTTSPRWQGQHEASSPATESLGGGEESAHPLVDARWQGRGQRAGGVARRRGGREGAGRGKQTSGRKPG